MIAGNGIHQIPPRQWLISRDVDDNVDSAGRYDLGPWHILTGPDLAIWPLSDPETAAVHGVMIGTPIDLVSKSYVSGALSLPAGDAAHLGTEKCIGDWLASFSGAFFAILKVGEDWVLYPSAANSCVYDTRTGRIGTTAAALLPEDDYRARHDHALCDKMRVSTNGWLPAGLTAHTGVRRLLPNHTLDLATMDVRRLWQGGTRTATEPEALVARIAEIARDTISIAVQTKNTALALTAGRDSRAILALVSALGIDLDTYTVAHENAGLDVEVARDLAASLGLRHRTIPQLSASPAEQALWSYLNGHVVGGINAVMHPTMRCFGRSDAVLSGSFGEVGRGFYWTATDTATSQMNDASLARRLDLKSEGPAVEALSAWVAALPPVDTLHALDLMYIEQRLGCWAAPQQVADPLLCAHPGPLQNLEIFDCLLSLPPDWRRKGRWVDEIVATHCVKLRAMPYNRHRVAWRHAANLGRKALSASRVRRGVRRSLVALERIKLWN